MLASHWIQFSNFPPFSTNWFEVTNDLTFQVNFLGEYGRLVGLLTPLSSPLKLIFLDLVGSWCNFFIWSLVLASDIALCLIIVVSFSLSRSYHLHLYLHIPLPLPLIHLPLKRITNFVFLFKFKGPATSILGWLAWWLGDGTNPTVGMKIDSYLKELVLFFQAKKLA